jgi:hypothetical protein
LALALWLTDWAHGISAAKVAFGVGLIGLFPFVGTLEPTISAKPICCPISSSPPRSA